MFILRRGCGRSDKKYLENENAVGGGKRPLRRDEVLILLRTGVVRTRIAFGAVILY